MNIKIHNIEYLLRYWENALLGIRALNEYPRGVPRHLIWPCRGPLKHWREFRKDLAAPDKTEFDEDKFVACRKENAELRSFLGGAAVIPQTVWKWAKRGKRTILVPSQMLRPLMNCSFGNLAFRDAPWPSITIMLCLEDEVSDGFMGFDTLVASFEQESDGVVCAEILICARSLRQRLMPKRDVRLHEDVIKLPANNRRLGISRQKLKAFFSSENQAGITFHKYRRTKGGELTFSEILEQSKSRNMTGPDRQRHHLGMRLAVAVYLYLNTIPSDQEQRLWQPLLSKERLPDSIANQAMVMTLPAVSDIAYNHSALWIGTAAAGRMARFPERGQFCFALNPDFQDGGRHARLKC